MCVERKRERQEAMRQRGWKMKGDPEKKKERQHCCLLATNKKLNLELRFNGSDRSHSAIDRLQAWRGLCKPGPQQDRVT